MSALDNWQFWLNLNRLWFNGHDHATWQWLVKQVVGSESLYSGRPNPSINPPNLNCSLAKLIKSNNATCDVDFWSLTSRWILIYWLWGAHAWNLWWMVKHWIMNLFFYKLRLIFMFLMISLHLSSSQILSIFL